jgi:Holliday junction resolvase RusA-like endonuclease
MNNIPPATPRHMLPGSRHSYLYNQHSRTWRVVVEAEPVPWAVYTKQGKPSTGFTNMRVYQTQIQAALKEIWAGYSPFAGHLQLEFTFARTVPASARKKEPGRTAWKQEHIKKRPDVTNYQKAAEDAMKGIVFYDDSQVVSVTSKKKYTESGGYTWISITALLKTQEES